jgi:alpha-D-ribose 1-methylphosphonate 5-triphosphate synthase subunit PhnG
MRMSLKEHGKSWERKVVRGSETVGHDVKREMGGAGTKLAKGARTVGRDVERAGKRVGRATRRGMTRVGNRLKPNRYVKVSP